MLANFKSFWYNNNVTFYKCACSSGDRASASDAVCAGSIPVRRTNWQPVWVFCRLTICGAIVLSVNVSAEGICRILQAKGIIRRGQMKNKITCIPLVVWSAFMFLVIHTLVFFTPPHSYDGSQGLFCCGLTPVENSFYKWGYADKYGGKVISCKYDEASDFDEAERAIVSKNGKEYLIDTEGFYKGDSPYDRIYTCDKAGYYEVAKDGKYNVINRYGRSIFKKNYQYVYDINDGNYFCAELDGKYGVIDYDENIVIPFEYDDCIRDWDGYLYTKQRGRQGIINYDNEIVVPFLYDTASMSEFGYKKVTSKEYYGLLDADNNMIVDVFYERLLIETPDRIIAEKNDRYGVIDTTEKIIVPFKYDDIKYNSEDKTWDVTSGDEKQKLDYDGNFISRYDKKDVIYSPIGIVDEERLKELDKIYGLEDGTHIVYYDGESAYHVEKDGKYGLMDAHSGEMIIPPVSDEFIDHIDGNALIYEGRNIRLVDKDNNVVFSTEGDRFDYGYDDYIRIYDNGKCTVLDKEFNEMFTMRASYISSFEDDGYAVFCSGHSYDDYGVVDKNGRIMFLPKYVGISFHNDDGA